MPHVQPISRISEIIKYPQVLKLDKTKLKENQLITA